MTVRIGMISFAHLHANSYAACLKDLAPEVELVGIFDDDADRCRKVSADYGVKPYLSCDELLKEDISGVIICTENAKHQEYTIRAAEAGKHVLCEKPISTSIQNANAMIEACKNHNIQLMIAFPCRYSTVLNRMKQLVAAGKVGNVLGMRGTNRGTMPGGWFVDKAMAGGGAVMDHTVHVVDVWRWMLQKEVVSVYAEADQRFYSDINIDDTGMLSLEFEGGIFATLDTSWSRPNNSFPTWGDVTIEIVGDQGSLSIDAFRQQIEVYNNKAVKAEWACWTDNIDLGLVKAFVKMMSDGGESPITGNDGLRAMEVALGAYRSIELGEPVSLPLVN